jgi:ubiquinone/menaquinone biosynthesis C-methylase UbiE
MSYDTYALVYDGEYQNCDDDIPFYLELARGKTTLELGCGTGRVAIPLAEAGCSIWALDISEAMLRQAQEKWASLASDTQERLHFIYGDMCRFSLEMRFDLIIVTFHSFMHLRAISDQLDALCCMRRHLSPQGRIVVNLYNPEPGSLPHHSGGTAPMTREFACDHDDPNTEQRVFVSSATTYDPLEQLIHDERIYEHVDPDGLVTSKRIIKQTFRHFRPVEFEHLLARAGLATVEVFGGYEREPLDGHSVEIVWVARAMTKEEQKATALRLA